TRMNANTKWPTSSNFSRCFVDSPQETPTRSEARFHSRLFAFIRGWLTRITRGRGRRMTRSPVQQGRLTADECAVPKLNLCVPQGPVGKPTRTTHPELCASGLCHLPGAGTSGGRLPEADCFCFHSRLKIVVAVAPPPLFRAATPHKSSAGEAYNPCPSH